MSKPEEMSADGLPETAALMAAAVRAGEVSPVALVERALERVERWQQHTNAFTQLLFGAAMEEARRIESAVAAGADPGPLGGVPVAVKDLYDLAGRDTTGCSFAYENNTASQDAELVRRLRAAGAIVVAKTNQHELAAGATNLISACGPTANPWDLSRMTGGSSGGSAAAVACGVVPIALGSDTGGSIRIPASFCGVDGLKPTHGRLPLDGLMALAPSLDCPGPLASTAEDLRLAWEALSGEDHDPRLKPGRAGILGGYFADRIQPEVVAAVRTTADTLRTLGVEVVRVDGSGIDDAPTVWNDFAWSQFAAVHGHLLEEPDLLHPLTASFLQYGLALDGPARLAARARAGEIAEWFAERLAGVDVLLAPSTPFPAPPSELDVVEVREGETMGVHGGAISALTRPVNLAGLPALAIPCGFSGDGLPLGAQVIAARGGEGLLLQVAAMLEAADERFRPRRPPSPS